MTNSPFYLNCVRSGISVVTSKVKTGPMNWNMQPVTTMKTKVAKVSGEPKTIGTADLKHIHYATRTMALE